MVNTQEWHLMNCFSLGILRTVWRREGILGEGNDFNITVYNLDNSIEFKTNDGPNPSFGTRIDAKVIPIDIIDSDAGIKKYKLNIQVW